MIVAAYDEGKKTLIFTEWNTLSSQVVFTLLQSKHDMPEGI